MQLVSAERISPASQGSAGLLPQGKGKASYTSSLPAESLARIWKPSRSATTSGRARNGQWRLRIERQSGPSLSP
ncbi:hypothetical protein PARHAE_03345 [Paracoccus haematequi]|uniref:Uncharacterized protein n=1 Tax=Paracoccus haematequi TaxID=2491866 RepID=A0A447IRM5_9RHOB|nr:hypothetical protein [Paracoccus haematequi]VDS10132.1 hypothetical protein PARHAE_03345 [Paracoccus haematequi]